VLRRTFRSTAFAFLVLGAVLAGGVVACSDDDGTARLSENQPDVVPQPDAPSDGALTLPYVTFDGETRTLADYAGRPLVVNFFSSWCTPCITEMPDFEAVHQDLGDRVAFVGINYGLGGETEKGARDIIERTGVTYDVGRDLDGELLEALGGVTMPTTVLVTADGTIADVRSGAVSEGKLRDLIRDELGIA
jgi:thiol-disulfide isomerase/thioredoxin